MIYIGSPANRFTGGPTLAHQLCYELNKKGFEACMYYYHAKKGMPLVHEKYKQFGNPYVVKVEDSKNTILIAPETAPDILKHHTKSKKIIWWMSVDNYFDKYLTSRRNKILNIGGLLKYNVFSNGNIHFAQSYYACDFLKDHGVKENSIFYLSDYVDSIFLEKSNIAKTTEKKDVIVYSPKRGLEFTKKIISVLPQYQWVPLERMTQEQMIDVMLESKLYIDFGNHPGKDRIPREAAICGNCIITSRKGSAANSKDIPIGEQFKFDDVEKNIEKIKARIIEIMTHYEEYSLFFENYRKKILKEKDIFLQDIDFIFKNIQ